MKNYISSKDSSTSGKDANSSNISQTSENTIDAFVLKSEVMDSEILWALKCINNHYSFRSCHDVGQLFCKMFPDSSIAKNFSCGEKKCAYLCHLGLAPYFEAELLKHCKNSEFFTLLFDETLNQTNQKKQLDIHIRYWHHEGNVRTQYLSSAFIGHARSEDILAKFYECVTRKLDLSKLLQISMDGPSVNWNFYNQLQQDLLKEYNIKCLTIGTCGLHIINNAFKHGISSTGWDLSSFLVSLYWIFKDSPARREDFLDISSNKKLPVKFCSYRWLENVPACERAIDIWEDLLLYIKKVESGQFQKIASKSFSNVAEASKDKTFLIKLHFFLSLSKLLLPFLECYQSDKPLMPFFTEDVLKVVNVCLHHFNILKAESYEKISKAENLCKFDFRDPNNHNAKSKVSLGFSADQILKEKFLKKEVSQGEVFTLKKDCQQAILVMLQHLLKKCPINYSVVRNVSCIDPRLMANNPEKSQNRMKNILMVLTQNKRILQKDCDNILLRFGEFLEKIVKTRMYEYNSFDPKSMSLDTFFSPYFTDSHYSEVWKIFKIIMILSHGQASVERGFSVNKAVEIENLKDSSYISQRIILEYIKFSGGILNIDINKDLRVAASSARKKYTQYIEEQKLLVRSQTLQTKRKYLEDEIEFLKSKKMFIQRDIEVTKKEADVLANEAEDKRNIDLFMKSNELRKIVKDKESEINNLNAKISEKKSDLKKCT